MHDRLSAPVSAYAKLRRWPRFAVKLPVRVYRDLPCGADEALGTNLNAGGMAVRTTVDLRVGDLISVEFTPPHADQAVTTRCFVRNANRENYGVEFITENDADYCAVGQIEFNLGRLAPTQ